MPKWQREQIYDATPPDDLAQFVADVRAEYGRQRNAEIRAAVERSRGLFAVETTFVRVGGDG